MSPELTTTDPAAPPPGRVQDAVDTEHIALFSEEELADLRKRWDDIQAGFVDEPRGAVEKADALVADAIARLSDGFSRTRADLDRQWKKGDAGSTEDFRQALRKYRSFFTRLLHT